MSRRSRSKLKSKSKSASQSPRPPGDAVGGPTEGQHRSQVILQVLTGQLGATAAADQLGISVPRVYQLRDKAQAAIDAACEPGQPGRPRKAPPHPDTVRAAELEQRVAQAKAELEAERLRLELGIFLPQVLTTPTPAPPAKKGRRTQRGHQADG